MQLKSDLCQEGTSFRVFRALIFVSFVVMPKRNLDHETREREDEDHEKKLTKWIG